MSSLTDEFGRALPTPRHSQHQDSSSSSRGAGGGPGAPPPTSREHHHHSRRHPPSHSHRGGGGPPPPSRRRHDPSHSSHPRSSTTATSSGTSPSAHPSARYVATPLLCEYLWNEEKREQRILDGSNNKNKKEPQEQASNNNNSPEETEQPPHHETSTSPEDASPQTIEGENKANAYTVYRRSYCATYLQHVFNTHLDDSWFRQLYSPKQRYRAALQERQRAQAEATHLSQQIQAALAFAPHTWMPHVSLSIKAEAQTTADQDTTMTTGATSSSPSRTTATSQSLSSSPPPPPLWHIPQAVQEGRLLQVTRVPSYVTNAQLWHALPPVASWWTAPTSKKTSDSATAATTKTTPPPPVLEILKLWSSTPSQTTADRVVFFEAPSATLAQALWYAFLQLDGRTTADGNHRSHSTMADVAWPIACGDAYRRTEYDADGLGGAPTDGTSVPDRHTVVYIRPYHSSNNSNTNVLSNALSAPRPADAKAASTLARALDIQQHIPPEVQLDALLETMTDSLAQNADAVGVDDNWRLDVAIAYLRRVHHVNFYKGCLRATAFANVLQGNEAASSIQFRRPYVPPEDDDEAVETVTAPSTDPAQEGTDSLSQANDEKEQDVALLPKEMTATPDALAAAKGAGLKDLLVQRLDEAIQHALTVSCDTWIAAAPYVVDADTDAAAHALQEAEVQTEATWLGKHSIDDEGRARCSFHFCHKLFKDQNFLQKHLKKKHYEYCLAEQAKCHDSYMMKAWERAGASVPRASFVGGAAGLSLPGQTSTRLIVPDILVDCGTKYGFVAASLYHVVDSTTGEGTNNKTNDDNSDDDDEVQGVIVDVVDPEPALWQQEQEQDRMERERREAAEAARARRREESRQQREQQQQSLPRKDKFVDVDDMKEEEVVTMTFDEVELPQPKKKKKKKKLL